MNRTKSVSQFLSDRGVCAKVNRVYSGLLWYNPEIRDPNPLGHFF